MEILHNVVQEFTKVEDIPDFWTLLNIKNVCSFIASNRDWPAVHIAAFFGWIEAFNHDSFSKKIDLSNPANGEVPLHVTVKRGHLELTKRLLALDCRLDIVTSVGDSVFHYAATTNPETIKVRGPHFWGRFRCYTILVSIVFL